jgi:serine/threonine protein phosphatase PrpC
MGELRAHPPKGYRLNHGDMVHFGQLMYRLCSRMHRLSFNSQDHCSTPLKNDSYHASSFACCRTQHAGMSGKNNEDRYAASSFLLSKEDTRPSIFAVVADGIGGHRAGEVAAELAVNYISMGVAESNAKKPVKILETAIHDASQAIASHSAGKEDEEGMGATCACVWVIENKLYTAYVGDSRLYLLRGKFIQRITIDHTWVQEAYEKGIITAEQMRDHPNVHVIRRHLGGILPEVDFACALIMKRPMKNRSIIRAFILNLAIPF